MRHRLLPLALIAAVALGGTAATAGSAYYYLYMSKEDGSRVCAQVPPGSGWKQMGGPFTDSRCRKKPK